MILSYFQRHCYLPTDPSFGQVQDFSTLKNADTYILENQSRDLSFRLNPLDGPIGSAVSIGINVLLVRAAFVLEDQLVIDVPPDETSGSSGHEPPVGSAPGHVIDGTVARVELQQELRLDASVRGQPGKAEVPERDVAVRSSTCT